MPDKCFNLAVVDPPYYDNARSIIIPGGDISTTGVKRSKYKMPHWEVPRLEYFFELSRVAEEQIIWGINYFHIQNMGPGRIVWDKEADNGTRFSDCEIAYCSAINHVEIFRYRWNGMIQQNMKKKRDPHSSHTKARCSLRLDLQPICQTQRQNPGHPPGQRIKPDRGLQCRTGFCRIRDRPGLF